MPETLKTFLWWLVAVLSVLAIPYFLFGSIADTQAEREQASQTQLAKCRIGQYCRIEGKRTYEFLTISRGMK